MSTQPNNPPAQNVVSRAEDNPAQRQSQGPSINFSMGPMSTTVQFANEEQFNRYGYNVLYQAHAASMQFAVLATQFAANQNTMMPMINPMFRPQSNATAPAITALSSFLFDLDSDVRTKTETKLWTQILDGPCLASCPKPYWRLQAKIFMVVLLELFDKDLQEARASVTIIEGSRFLSCAALESMKIPYSVTSVWAAAFHECCALKHVYLL